MNPVIFEIPGVPSKLVLALSKSAANSRIALVGGVVRDYILNKLHNNKQGLLADLDLLVEGAATDFVSRLTTELTICYKLNAPISIMHYPRYGSYKLSLVVPLSNTVDFAIDIDVSSARKEHYNAPGFPPLLDYGATLEQDLSRRDFTINGIALELSTKSEGQYQIHIVDPFNGRNDIKNKLIRVLHENSFSDDPSRIVRAAHYASRLKFQLEPKTRLNIQHVLRAWPWDWKHDQDPTSAPPSLAYRLSQEIHSLLASQNWHDGLYLLASWGALDLFDTKLQLCTKWIARLYWSERLHLPRGHCLIANSFTPVELASRMRLAENDIKSLARMEKLNSILSLSDFSDYKPSQWCELLEGNKFGAKVVALSIVSGCIQRRALLRWYFCWRFIKADVCGSDLIDQGYRPGPAINRELKYRRKIALDEQSY